MLRKDCLDAAFGQFLSLTEWVCWKREVSFAKVNSNDTSQICPNCLASASKGLEVRDRHCSECGYGTDRDYAAVEMVLHRGLEKVVSQKLWGTEIACQVGRSGVYDLNKQEYPIVRLGSPRCTHRVSVGRMSRMSSW